MKNSILTRIQVFSELVYKLKPSKSRLALLILVIDFIFYILLFQYLNISILYCFIILGLIIGVYYGSFNHKIFHNDAKYNNEFDKVDVLWIHIVCGVLSSVGLFLLFTKFNK